jgi:hypothetical protein
VLTTPFSNHYQHEYYSEVDNEMYRLLHDNALPPGITREPKRHDEILWKYRDEIKEMLNLYEDDNILLAGRARCQQPKQAEPLFKYSPNSNQPAEVLEQELREYMTGQISVGPYPVGHAFDIV